MHKTHQQNNKTTHRLKTSNPSLGVAHSPSPLPSPQDTNIHTIHIPHQHPLTIEAVDQRLFDGVVEADVDGGVSESDVFEGDDFSDDDEGSLRPTVIKPFKQTIERGRVSESETEECACVSECE